MLYMADINSMCTGILSEIYRSNLFKCRLVESIYTEAEVLNPYGMYFKFPYLVRVLTALLNEIQ
jgi:hypothetical protein